MTDVVVSTYEAKTQLSRLLAACQRGDNVTIARGATPIARLVPVEVPARRDSGFLPVRMTEQAMAESVAPLEANDLSPEYAAVWE